jgi:cytochrome c
MYKVFVIIFSLGTLGLLSFNRSGESYDRMYSIEEEPLENVLLRLGDEPSNHSIRAFDPDKAKRGEDLIRYGRTMKDGKRTKRISKHFVCTDCHNERREFADLTKEAPSERLQYAIDHGMSFLPASTFWGIYNRTTFYNQDWEKKYGELVVNSRDSLNNATQLCAKYCSSGRDLEPWELEAIMHYYKKNELRIGDLKLPNEIRAKIEVSHALSTEEKKNLISDLKTYYRQSYSATFLPTMPRNERKYGEGGDAKRGEKIYEKSCLHCHANKRVTNLNLDKGKLSAGMFWRKRKGYSDKSLYQIIRYGTYSMPGRKQYMPNYTKEKMSDEQINDLMAYIKQLADK